MIVPDHTIIIAQVHGVDFNAKITISCEIIVLMFTDSSRLQHTIFM